MFSHGRFDDVLIFLLCLAFLFIPTGLVVFNILVMLATLKPSDNVLAKANPDTSENYDN